MVKDMVQYKSKIRLWVESRLTGKISDKEWNKIKGIYSNDQIKSLSRERALEIIGRYDNVRSRVRSAQNVSM